TYEGSRDGASAFLRAQVEEYPEVLGVGAAYEPDAFDGADAAHADDPTAMKGGRFGPYWHRSDGGIVGEPLVGADTEDWYTVPMETKDDLVAEPFLYNDTLMTTYASPIVRGDRAVGIVFNDLSLEYLDAETRKIEVLDSGYAFLV